MATKASHFLSLIHLSRSSHDLKPLFSLITVHGFQTHHTLITQFLTHCLTLGLPHLALSAFRTLQTPNLRLTIPAVAKACAALGAERTGREAHCAALRTGLENDVVAQTALLCFYAKCGRAEKASHVLEAMPRPDLVAWNALIAGRARNALDGLAAEAFAGLLGADLRPNSSTLASVIPVLSRLGWIEIGESLHCYALKLGYLRSGFLVPALISMYGGGSDLRGVRNLFDFANERDVSAWNALIFAYSTMKMPMEAFSTFVSMLENGVEPDLITLVSVIPSCESVNGEAIHAFAIKHWAGNRAPVMAALVTMYAKLGDIVSSDRIFHETPHKNRLSWNSMISGYVHNGLWEPSLAVFREMRVSGLNPDEISLVGAITACAKLKTLSLGESAHALSLRTGLNSALNVSNALLALYAACRERLSCFELFEEMPARCTVSWNTLIACVARDRETATATAMSILRRMYDAGFEPDSVTLISLVSIFGESESLGQGMAVHCKAIKSGFSLDISLANAVISMYCNCGDLEAGGFAFDDVPDKRIASWNALLTGLRDRGLYEDVLVLFDRMTSEGKGPNHITLLSLLPGCRSELQGRSIHGFAIRTEIARENPVVTSLMFMYARFDNVRLALVLFGAAKNEGVAPWNAAMSVLTQARNPRSAIAVFSGFLRAGFEPDSFTVRSLIAACIQLNGPKKLADSIAGYLLRKQLDKDVTVSNGLIDMYSKCGDIAAARKIFDRIARKDGVSWGAMINGYGLNGDGGAALDLLARMGRSGLKPDGIAFSAALSACSHAGLAEEGLAVLRSMADFRVSPRAEHYACVVDLLARAGRLREARGLVEAMPAGPAAGPLEALLGGCGAFGDVEIGAEIGGKLADLDPENSGPYVMLHNVYASAGRWGDAERVRAEIEKKGLRKVPGFSLFVEGGA